MALTALLGAVSNQGAVPLLIATGGIITQYVDSGTTYRVMRFVVQASLLWLLVRLMWTGW